jgi:SAM-dependent methyltransferase
LKASHWTHLERIRRAEGELALGWMRQMKPPPARLIEIGGGTGWQSQEFSSAGYDVVSYDLASTEYTANRMFPVRDYDGHKIPEPDGTADIVFSSNVLEHIPHVVAFQSEMLRVLKPDGIALHILPSAPWRLWTSATHYPWVARKVALDLMRRQQTEESESSASRPIDQTLVAAEPNRRSNKFSRLLANNLLPVRHGEFGNSLTELYYFSRFRWTQLFEAAGWRIDTYATNKLAYTSHGLFGLGMGLAVRRRLSHVLGSSCHVFVLRKA